MEMTLKNGNLSWYQSANKTAGQNVGIDIFGFWDNTPKNSAPFHHRHMNMSPNKPFLLGFAAYSGTGKTTLLEQLIPLFKARGLKIGVIKHSHHNFEIDYPRKDSYRLRVAGATPTMLVSSHRRVIISELNGSHEPNLFDELGYFPTEGLDLILVEGFRHAAIAKIELHRAILGKPLLCTNDPNIIAIASDTPIDTPNGLPKLDLNQVNSIVDFILHLLGTS